eukprot:SAG31_NODE_55_length_29938_cov_9.154027_26_plen_247_part_00
MQCESLQEEQVEAVLSNMLHELYRLAASSNLQKKSLGMRGLHHLVMEASAPLLNRHREMLNEALLQAIGFREAEVFMFAVPAAARLVTRIHKLHGDPSSSRVAHQALESCHGLFCELLRALAMIEERPQRIICLDGLTTLIETIHISVVQYMQVCEALRMHFQHCVEEFPSDSLQLVEECRVCFQRLLEETYEVIGGVQRSNPLSDILPDAELVEIVNLRAKGLFLLRTLLVHCWPRCGYHIVRGF